MLSALIINSALSEEHPAILNSGSFGALLKENNMTGKMSQTRLTARIRETVECIAGLLAVFSATAVLGQAGPVLPPQGPQMINALTTLVVNNTATEPNIPPNFNRRLCFGRTISLFHIRIAKHCWLMVGASWPLLTAPIATRRLLIRPKAS